MVTEPACNGEVIVLTGEGFDPASTRIVAMALGDDDSDFNPQEAHAPADYLNTLDDRPSLPATPPKNALPCEVLGGDDGWLHVRMRCSRRSWVRVPATTVIWEGDEAGWSKPYVVNRPQAQWLSPTSAAPGEAIRIFGRTFDWGWQIESAVAYVRKVGASDPIPLSRAPEHREDRQGDDAAAHRTATDMFNLKGIVWCAYQDGQGRPLVMAYDVASRLWAGPVRASEHGLGSDTHGNPSLCLDSKGYLHVFFGCHGRVMHHIKSMWRS